MDRNKLFNDNKRLVYHVFNELKRSLKPYVVNNNTDDFIQEGYMGLWKASKNFNPDKGIPFSNYACIVIKNHMLMYLKKINGRHKVKVELVSLNVETGEEIELQDVIATPEKEDVSWALESDQLSELERIILRKIYEGYTCREIGAELGFSGQYAHQQYKSALSKLRRSVQDE